MSFKALSRNRIGERWCEPEWDLVDYIEQAEDMLPDNEDKKQYYAEFKPQLTAHTEAECIGFSLECRQQTYIGPGPKATPKPREFTHCRVCGISIEDKRIDAQFCCSAHAKVFHSRSFQENGYQKPRMKECLYCGSVLLNQHGRPYCDSRCEREQWLEEVEEGNRAEAS